MKPVTLAFTIASVALWGGRVLRPFTWRLLGFFYTGPNDLVECYHCGVKLKSWKTFHSPYFEHEQWSKSCPCVGQYHITKSYQEFNSTDPGRT